MHEKIAGENLCLAAVKWNPPLHIPVLDSFIQFKPNTPPHIISSRLYIFVGFSGHKISILDYPLMVGNLIRVKTT